MKKDEFLTKLRKELDILEESEIEDILNEYEGYIDEKIKKGTSEEDAVKSMGDVYELASDLLSAYKIKKPKEKDSFNDLANSAVNIFNHIVDILANKSFSEIIRFIIEIVIIFFIISLFKIPFEILDSVIKKAFYNLGALNLIRYVISFILELVYLIFAIILFIRIFEKRYLKDLNPSHINTGKTFKNEKVKPEKIIKEEVEKKEHNSLISSLSEIFLILIKFIIFWFLLGSAFYIFMMAIVLGLCLYLLFKGVTYLGIYLSLFSLFNFGILIFIFLYNFIFNRKTKHSLFLITLITNFIILGVGVGIGSIEIANTSFNYDINIINPQTKEVLVDMKDNMILPYNFTDKVIVDDTLGDKIKIEYIFASDIDLYTNTYLAKNGTYQLLICNYDIERFNYNPEILNNLIQDLKDKNIHSYDLVQIKIYASLANKTKLEENRMSYDNM